MGPGYQHSFFKRSSSPTACGNDGLHEAKRNSTRPISRCVLLKHVPTRAKLLRRAGTNGARGTMGPGEFLLHESCSFQDPPYRRSRLSQSGISLSLPISLRCIHLRYHARTTARPSRVSQVQAPSPTSHRLSVSLGPHLIRPSPSDRYTGTTVRRVLTVPLGRYANFPSRKYTPVLEITLAPTRHTLRALPCSQRSVRASTDTSSGSRRCRHARVYRPSSTPLGHTYQAARDDEHQTRGLGCGCSPLARGLKSP